jgi:hypothetical protein
MKTRQRFALSGALSLCLLAFAVLIGCESKSDSSQAEASLQTEYSTQGELVFSDDFEDGALEPEWVRGEGEDGAGKWTIEDGKLVGVDLRNDPLWLQEELPESVRIEFDAQARSPVGDIKVEVFGDGTNHESGYILIFGGWNNTLDVIARRDEHGEDRKARDTHGVVPGHTYRMAVERTGATLEWYVDGELFMSYEDAEPLRGDGHRHFAFGVWSAPVHFDNVDIYDLSK